MKKLLLFIARNSRSIFCATAIVAFIGVLYLFALNGRYQIIEGNDTYFMYDRWNERIFKYSNDQNEVRYDKVELVGNTRRGITWEVAEIKSKREEVRTSMSEHVWREEVDSAVAVVDSECQ